MEQEPIPISELLVFILYLGSITFLLGAAFQGYVLYTNRKSILTSTFVIILTRVLTIFSSYFIWAGTFTGAGVKTVVLFFEKGKATQKVWFYQLNLDRNLGKTNPLNEKDLAEFVELQKTFADSENSWTINIEDVDQSTFDLSVKNPNTPEADPLRQPQEILAEMRKLDSEVQEVLDSIADLIV